MDISILENTSDVISRQAAIDAAKHAWAKGLEPSQYIELLPSAQPDVPDTNVGDMISKQVAMEMLMAQNVIMDGSEYYNGFNAGVNRAQEVIRNLPPVQPKHGKWVFKTVFPNDTSEFPMGYLVCSECGSKHANKTPCNFCDNCGADMRGGLNG